MLITIQSTLYKENGGLFPDSFSLMCILVRLLLHVCNDVGWGQFGNFEEFLLYQSTPSEIKASVDHW